MRPLTNSPTSWLDWGVWDFISAVASVLSLLALVFAIYGYFLRQRRVENVVLSMDIIGTAEIGGEKYHLADFYNAGSGAADLISVTFVRSEYRPTPDYRFKRVMGSGDSVQVLIAAPRIREAWIVAIWREYDDRRTFRAMWMPLVSETPLYKKWEESVDRTPRRRWWQGGSRRGPTCPIGPDYYASTALVARGSTAPEKDIDVLAQGFGDEVVVSWSPGSGEGVKDLPTSR